MEREVQRESEPETAESLRKKTLSREELLAMASELSTFLHERTTRPSFRESAIDKTRLSYARAATAAIAATGAILKDQELDEIRERLDAIEQRRTWPSTT